MPNSTTEAHQEKSAVYYDSAIQYNEELAKFAKDLALRLEDKEVARWAWSVFRLHKEHTIHHKKARARAQRRAAAKETKQHDSGQEAVVETVEAPNDITEAQE